MAHGSKMPQLAADAGDGLVLRPIDDDALSRVRPGAHFVVIDGVGAGDGAAVPAAIGQPLRVARFPHVAVDLGRLRVRAEAEVVDGQQVVVVHNLHQEGGAPARHPVLDGVPGADFAVHRRAGLRQAFEVGGGVGLAREGRGAHDEGLDALVAEHGADAAAPGLLVAQILALAVVEAEVEAAHPRVLRAAPGGDEGDEGLVGVGFGEVVEQPVAEDVGVGGAVVGRFQEAHGACMGRRCRR